MGTRKVLKQMNFNFSDDSDDETSRSNNSSTGSSWKDPMDSNLLSMNQNNTDKAFSRECKPVPEDKSIIASAHLQRRSELPSLCEDLGTPITESTRLYTSGADAGIFTSVDEENSVSDRLDVRKWVKSTATSFTHSHPPQDTLHQRKKNGIKRNEDKENLMSHKHTHNHKREPAESNLTSEGILKRGRSHVKDAVGDTKVNIPWRPGNVSLSVKSAERSFSSSKAATPTETQLEWDELPKSCLKEKSSSSKKLLPLKDQNFTFTTPTLVEESKKGRMRNINPLHHGRRLAFVEKLRNVEDDPDSLGTEECCSPCHVTSDHSLSNSSPCHVTNDHSLFNSSPCHVTSDHSLSNSSPCHVTSDHSLSNSYVEVQDESVQTSFSAQDPHISDEEVTTVRQVISSAENSVGIHGLESQSTDTYVEVQDVSLQTSFSFEFNCSQDERSSVTLADNLDIHTTLATEHEEPENVCDYFSKESVCNDRRRDELIQKDSVLLTNKIIYFDKELLQQSKGDKSSSQGHETDNVSLHFNVELNKSSFEAAEISEHEVEEVSRQSSHLDVSSVEISDRKLSVLTPSTSKEDENKTRGAESQTNISSFSDSDSASGRQESSPKHFLYKTACENSNNETGTSSSSSISDHSRNSSDKDTSLKESLYETACDFWSFCHKSSLQSSDSLEEERADGREKLECPSRSMSSYQNVDSDEDVTSGVRDVADDEGNDILAAASDSEDDDGEKRTSHKDDDEREEQTHDTICESDLEESKVTDDVDEQNHVTDGADDEGVTFEKTENSDNTNIFSELGKQRQSDMTIKENNVMSRGEEAESDYDVVSRGEDSESDHDVMSRGEEAESDIDVSGTQRTVIERQRYQGSTEKRETENCLVGDDQLDDQLKSVTETNVAAEAQACILGSSENDDEDEKNINTPDDDIDRVAERLGGISVSSHRQKQVVESSDDDSDFENFLNKIKNPAKPRKAKSTEMMPLSQFIVDDDDDEEADESSDNSYKVDDDEMFHIKLNNELERGKSRRYRHQEVRYRQYHSDGSHSHSDDDSHSDLDDFIVDKPAKQNVDKVKSSASFSLSSDDDSLFEEKSHDEVEEKSDDEAASTNKKVVQDGNYAGSSCTVESNSVNQQLPLSVSGKPRAFLPHLPCDSHFKTPQKTPFKTPRSQRPWQRPFETPTNLKLPRGKSEENYQTPSFTKGAGIHPSTAPHPSRPSIAGVDDNTFFLKSLSADYPDYKRHPDAARFVKRFKDLRADLVQKLFKIFNGAVFEEQLPQNFEIEWSTRYTKTAGTFYYKGTTTNFKAKVTLSVKICDSPERVRDTLAHELCHAAVKLINGANESHGKIWKSWAYRTNKTFPFMPVIARCHDYVVNTKYTYQCVSCKYRIGRHSKSLDIERKVCGHCHGRFQVYLTSELNSSTGSGSSTPATPRTPRTPNKFALFVKECYSDVKKRDRGLKHGDVMKILSKEFAEKNKISE